MTKDMLSQSEIDALLKGDINTVNDENSTVEELGSIEKDAIGEIGNISMGTAATTLSTLLNKKVVITTPKVEVTNVSMLADEYTVPFVAIDVSYKSGLEGANVLILKADDVKIITDILMGKEEIDLERELTELDLSAVSEVMNQMMGSAATSLSEIFNKPVNIEPPKSYQITFDEAKDKIGILKNNQPVVKVSFRMIVGDLIDSQIMQLIPIEFAKNIVNILLGDSSENNDENEILDEVVVEKEGNEKKTMPYKDTQHENIGYNKKIGKYGDIDGIPSENTIDKDTTTVTVKKPVFETFDKTPNVSYNESIELVGEIPVEITVELGKTTKKIGEILEYGPGTIVELDKLVGEPLNIYANGKFIAKGEVVVIDDSFGTRITDIVNPYKKYE